MPSNCDAREDSWKSLGCKEIKPILRKINPAYSLEGLMLKLQYFGHLMWTDDSLEKSQCWERLRAEEEVRGWDGWTASLMEWTWTWANSGRWWGTGRPGMLQSMGIKSDMTRWLNNNHLFILYWGGGGLVAKTCPTLLWRHGLCSLPGSSVHRISQAVLEWVVICFSRGSSQFRGQTLISCNCRWILYSWAAGETWYSGYSGLTTLWYFQVNSKGTQPYVYMYSFSPKLPSHSGCHITLSRVPCAIQ